MKSLDVKVWGVRKRNTKKSSYDVRWIVAGNVFSDQFRTKGLADHYRSKLLRAAHAGEEFDTVTGLPDSMIEKAASTSWYAFALKYLAMKWPHAAPNTRSGINESLTAVTMALLDDRPGWPPEELIRKTLRNWGFVLPGPDDRDLPDDVASVLHWVSKASRPLADLGDAALARAVLDLLKLKLDGTAAAAETVRRKRRTLVNALHYAVDLGEFKENPITGIRWKKPKVAGEVDPRVVANPEQARSLLTAVSYVGGYGRARGRRLVGLFACMYYGAFRPAEVVGLTEADLKLPEAGWGTALLHRTRPTAGKQWTDSGETHDDRGLKNRPAEEVRPVPIPPQLVAILRQHLDVFGTAEDGRMFTNERGGVVGSSTYYRVWQEARLFWRFRRPPSPRRSLRGRMTCGTRRCPPGSTPEWMRPRLPNGQATVWKSCCLAMPNASMVGRRWPTERSRSCCASTSDRTPKASAPSPLGPGASPCLGRVSSAGRCWLHLPRRVSSHRRTATPGVPSGSCSTPWPTAWRPSRYGGFK